MMLSTSDRKIIQAFIFLMANLITVNTTIAQDTIVVRQAIIQADPPSSVIEPNAIDHAADGGFLIAGRIQSRQQAWAAKTDANGKVLWQYHIGVRPEDNLPIGQGAEFQGVVAMPDGSSFFCGEISSKPVGFRPVLLVHLDMQGAVISEQTIAPQKQIKIGNASTTYCARWGDGFVFIGLVFHPIRQADEKNPPLSETSYWVMTFNPKGERIWETLIPTKFAVVPSEIKSVFIDQDLSIYLSASRFNETEITKISPTGNILLQREINGGYQFIKTISEDKTLKLFGFLPGPVSILITLDKNLNEISRIQNGNPPNIYPRLVYQLPDKTLFLSGESSYFSQALLKTSIAHLDQNLAARAKIELEKAPFYDGGILYASTTTGIEGGFVTARSFAKHVQGPESRIGAVLDFINVNVTK